MDAVALFRLTLLKPVFDDVQVIGEELNNFGNLFDAKIQTLLNIAKHIHIRNPEPKPDELVHQRSLSRHPAFKHLFFYRLLVLYEQVETSPGAVADPSMGFDKRVIRRLKAGVEFIRGKKGPAPPVPEDLLDLLLRALPKIRPLTNFLETKVAAKDQRRDYLTNIRSSAMALRIYLGTIRDRGEAQTLRYPCLEKLADCAYNFSMHPINFIQQGLISQSGFNREDVWKELEFELERLVDKLQKYGEDVKSYRNREINVRACQSAEEVCDFVEAVLRAVSCKCSTPQLREARLQVSTYQRLKSGRQQDDNAMTMPVLFKNSPTPATYEKDRYFRGNVALYREGLSHVGAAERSFDNNHLLHQVDLKTLFSRDSVAWSPLPQLILGVLLSYSLVYMCGEDKTHNVWGPRNIFLFQQGKEIPLRLFVGKPAQARVDLPHSDLLQFHGYPRVLELGAILLQIHLGQKIETFLGLKEDLKLGYDLPRQELNTLYLKVTQAFTKGKDRIESFAAREAIDVCLSNSWHPHPNYPLTIQEIRNTLLTKVVRPLEDELRKCFGNQSLESLDKEAEKHMITLHEPIEAPIPSGTRGLEMGLPLASNAAPLKANKKYRRHSMWNAWLDEFKIFRDEILRSGIDSDKHRRVRITIIDTGIDATHPLIKSGGWEYDDPNAEKRLFRDFATKNGQANGRDRGADQPVDEDGHGTFIAGIFMQMVPGVELSVARIGETLETIRCDDEIGEKLSQAIMYATEKWKTDIISISLGTDRVLSKVGDALDCALKNDVVVFASAGNSGNNKGIAYPASADRVFKIFAVTADGLAAGFSPRFLQRRPLYQPTVTTPMVAIFCRPGLATWLNKAAQLSAMSFTARKTDWVWMVDVAVPCRGLPSLPPLPHQ
ncbi:unnamed protein product [Parascedosporium putredinis]|uniref:Peptidase S8/S53 domain-containing protein n=1 Tax=Parascedosporium putredinis TaxID=1442378 RepID=A0A9P1M9H7_9PEZI|nr:unnamed protein product [Parascedosporium putredinis]CAI7991985.1 unnamed protein product [Parascedosporium putredinis]